MSQQWFIYKNIGSTMKEQQIPTTASWKTQERPTKSSSDLLRNFWGNKNEAFLVFLKDWLKLW